MADPSAQDEASTNVPTRYATLWPIPRAATLAVSSTEGQTTDDHHRGADQRAPAGDERRRTAVTERVEAAREEEEPAVDEQADTERRERGGEELGIVATVPERDHLHRRQRERDERRRHRQQEARHPVESPTDPIGERHHVAGAGVEGDLGEDRGVHRLREDRVRAP